MTSRDLVGTVMWSLFAAVVGGMLALAFIAPWQAENRRALDYEPPDTTTDTLLVAEAPGTAHTLRGARTACRALMEELDQMILPGQVRRDGQVDRPGVVDR